MIFVKSIYNEVIKIALKPRSYLGIAAITVLVGGSSKTIRSGLCKSV